MQVEPDKSGFEQAVLKHKKHSWEKVLTEGTPLSPGQKSKWSVVLILLWTQIEFHIAAYAVK